MPDARTTVPGCAVVDSGIDTGHPGLRGRAHVVHACRVPAVGPIETEPPGRDALGHGTAVAVTIAALVRGVAFASVRVLIDAATCRAATLAAALRHCAGLDVAVVNVSLGCSPGLEAEDDRATLAAAVAALVARGRHVVAPATTTAGLPAWPGSLPGVDAVQADANVERHAPRLRIVGERRLWAASPFPPANVPGLPAAHIHGASLAVAHVSAHLLTRG